MIQELLPYLAGLLQWARAQERFSEVWFALIVVVASFGFYALANPTNALSVPWDQIVAGWWEQAKTILAVTQTISTGSNIAVKLGANPKHPLVPVTSN